MRGCKHLPDKDAVFLYFICTLLLVLIFGVLFSEIGLYPSADISRIVKSVGIDVAVLVGLLATVFRFVGGLYQRVRVHAGRIIWASVITVVLVVLFLFVYFYHIAEAAKDAKIKTAATATVVAQENAVATATARANVGATASAVATSLAQASATARAIASHYPFSRALFLRDLLEGMRSPNFWDATPNANGGCRYQGFAYEVSTSERANLQRCFAEGPEYFTNFTYEIQMRIIQGDCGGIAFRASDANLDFYIFKICQDGSFDFGMFANGMYKEISSGDSANIWRGHTGINTIAVVARKCEIQIYVNAPDRPVFQASECAYGAGHIGVFASSNGSKQPTRVLFAHAKVWKL